MFKSHRLEVVEVRLDLTPGYYRSRFRYRLVNSRRRALCHLAVGEYHKLNPLVKTRRVIYY